MNKYNYVKSSYKKSKDPKDPNKPKISKKKKLLMKNRFIQHNSIIQLNIDKLEELQNTNKLISDLNKKKSLLQDEKTKLEHTNAINKLNNNHIYSTFSNIKEIDKKIIEIEKEINYINSGDNILEYILHTYQIINDYTYIEDQEKLLIKKLDNNNKTAQLKKDNKKQLEGKAQLKDEDNEKDVQLEDEDNEKDIQLEDEEDIEELLYKLNINKRELSNKYMKYIDPTFIEQVDYSKYYNTLQSICETCNIPLLVEEGHATCYECGLCIPTLHQSAELSYKELQEVDFKPAFSYQKLTHLEDWLRRFQAKEHKDIPQEILDKVILEAHKARITDLNNLTEEKVKKYLKKLELNDYYDNIINIINRINKRPCFTLTPDIEDKIKKMFNQIQEPFEKYKGTGRKNMLSYSYILHKFFLILELPEFAKYFFLLKSTDKLRQQDETFKKIVDEMVKIDPTTNWKFYPSF